LATVQVDCLSAPEVVSSRPESQFRTRCTVGLMLNDLTIHGMVVGGPAFKSRQVLVGDRIIAVDGKRVGLDDYEEALVGSDVPDSEVILTVYRESDGAEREISLRRMPRVQMADHVKMFELFTQLGGLAVDSGSDEISACLQDAVRLWTKMQVCVRIGLQQMPACLPGVLRLMLAHLLRGSATSAAGCCCEPRKASSTQGYRDAGGVQNSADRPSKGYGCDPRRVTALSCTQ
jgi:hypothetical protein